MPAGALGRFCGTEGQDATGVVFPLHIATQIEYHSSRRTGRPEGEAAPICLR